MELLARRVIFGRSNKNIERDTRIIYTYLLNLRETATYFR